MINFLVMSAVGLASENVAMALGDPVSAPYDFKHFPRRYEVEQWCSTEFVAPVSVKLRRIVQMPHSCDMTLILRER